MMDVAGVALVSSRAPSPELLSAAAAVSSCAAPMAELDPGPSSYDLPSSVIFLVF